MAAEQQRIEELSAQLADAQALLEKYEAQLRVYMLSRDLSDGDAYTATTLGGDIHLSTDQTQVEWNYTNNSISGNEVVISLTLDDEELFRSASLKPGESLTELTLNHALQVGTYEAVVVASVYDNGEIVSATRTPIEITVE